MPFHQFTYRFRFELLSGNHAKNDDAIFLFTLKVAGSTNYIFFHVEKENTTQQSMEEQDQTFDESVYKELNLYFRSKIKELLSAHPDLQLMQQENRLQLNDLVACMHLEDQNRWNRFLQMDQLKLNQDIMNHLEGKGEPFHPGSRIGNPFADLTGNPETW